MEKTLSLHEKLVKIQTELNAPKGNFNTFGGYSYRSAEDILAAVKPYLKELGLVLTLSDKIEFIGNRYYVKATASLSDDVRFIEVDEDGRKSPEGAYLMYNISQPKSISVSAYAREEETKKGMDAAQITGSASSYARKYCLSGLFGLDDEKDADATNNHGKDQGYDKANQEQNRKQYSNTGASSNPGQAPAKSGAMVSSPASDAQKAALSKMGIPFNENISKSEASDLIKNANNKNGAKK